MPTHLLNPLQNQTLAYTDGACRGNGSDDAKGGFGAVVILPNGEQTDICGGEIGTTNNRMELMGAIAALENSPTHLPIQIWTDSNYVKDGITKWIAGWKAKGWRKSDGKAVLNVELWQRLDQACQNRQIDWQWVKGHAGHDGNEYADTLANRGIDNLPKPFEKIVNNSPNLPTTSPDFDEIPMDVYQDMPPMTDFDDASYDVGYDADFAQSFDNETDEFENDDNDFLLNALDDSDNQTDNQTDNQVGDEIDENTSVEDVSDDEATAKKPKKSKNNKPKKPILAERFKPFVNENEQFIAQNDELLAIRPDFNGNTVHQNDSFVPLLPIAKNAGVANRQLILDTETTGFDFQNADRIIEIGAIELINRKFTGERLHIYINPMRDVPEDSLKVHGIHEAFLADMPTFDQVGKVVYDFLQGAELIAHNANFDIGFLQAEFARIGLGDFDKNIHVIDSLALAKQKYPGQRNSLDALVNRLNVGKQDRTFHGALLDSEILAEVYLAMTGGQVALAIDDTVTGGASGGEHQRFSQAVARFVADTNAEQAHLEWLQCLQNKYPKLAENWGIKTIENDETTA